MFFNKLPFAVIDIVIYYNIKQSETKNKHGAKWNVYVL